MATLFTVFSVCACLTTALATCPTYSAYPDEDRRMYTYDGGISSGSDRYITEAWYGNEGLQLSTSPVDGGYKKCGSLYPIWMNDTPPSNGESKSVKVCLQDHEQNCVMEWEIEAMGCETTTIYKLSRPSEANSMYCIVPPVDVVVPSTEVEYTHNDKSHFHFLCAFGKVADKDLFYTVIWYINNQRIFSTDNEGVKRYTFEAKTWSNGIKQSTALTEEILKENDITSIGFDYHCALRLRNEKDGAPGVLSKSDTKFAGIKVLTPNIVVKRDVPAVVRLKSTMEIHCGNNIEDEYCSLNIDIWNTIDTKEAYDNGECDPDALLVNCIVQITKSDWNKEYTFNVTLQSPETFGEQVAWGKIHLSSPPSNNKMPFWAKSTIDDITMELQKKATYAEDKRCFAVIDPHMQTFDGRKYEHQFEGRHTLYKHKSLPMEVQMESRSCNYDKAYCACGLAVRAGKTVFRIDHCEPERKYNEFVTCDDEYDMLHVQQDGKFFKITMPTGTKVTAKTQNYGIPTMNIFIDPAGADIEQTQGLCGSLTNACQDDFILRTGSNAQNSNSKLNCEEAKGHTIDVFEDFSDSWRVGDNDDLFTQRGISESLTGWSEAGGKVYCKCEKDQGQKVNCGKSETKNCRAESHIVESKSHCNIQSRRRRTIDNDSRDQTFSYRTRSRQKRELTWKNGWTEETARTYCVNLFNASTSINLCQHVPGVDVESNIANCILDIQITGDDIFSTAAVESTKTSCLKEVQLNTSLQIVDEETGTSIADEVLAVTCPNECSYNGTCENGACVCYEHYGAADCSVDVRVPPENYGLFNDGHCDLQHETCDETSLFVDYVIDSATCKIRVFKVQADGMVASAEEATSHADPNTFSEAICSLPTTNAITTPGVDIAHGFLVSVANNGEDFSAESHMVVYDSACQMCEVTDTVQCWFTSPACLVDGRCHDNGLVHPGDPCSYCEANMTSRKWTKSTEPPCFVAETTTSNYVRGGSDLPNRDDKDIKIVITGAVVGGIVAIVILSVLLGYTFRKMNRPHNSISTASIHGNLVGEQSTKNTKNA